MVGHFCPTNKGGGETPPPSENITDYVLVSETSETKKEIETITQMSKTYSTKKSDSNITISDVGGE